MKICYTFILICILNLVSSFVEEVAEGKDGIDPEDKDGIDREKEDRSGKEAETSSNRAAYASKEAGTASDRAKRSSKKAETASERAETPSEKSERSSEEAETASMEAATATVGKETVSKRKERVLRRVEITSKKAEIALEGNETASERSSVVNGETTAVVQQDSIGVTSHRPKMSPNLGDSQHQKVTEETEVSQAVTEIGDTASKKVRTVSDKAKEESIPVDRVMTMVGPVVSELPESTNEKTIKTEVSDKPQAPVMLPEPEYLEVFEESDVSRIESEVEETTSENVETVFEETEESIAVNEDVIGSSQNEYESSEINKSFTTDEGAPVMLQQEKQPAKKTKKQKKKLKKKKKKKSISDVKYMAFMALVETKNGTCTASLIEPEWVITSGSCIAGSSEDDVKVYLNVTESKSKDTKIQVNVSSLVVHPEYIYGEVDNDIGLIRLEEPVTLSHEIQTVDVGIEYWSETKILRCLAAGYNYGISFGMAVKAGRGKENCLCLSEEKFICINESLPENKCIQDIGGPLICSNQLVGVRIGAYEKSNCPDLSIGNATLEEGKEFDTLQSNKTKLLKKFKKKRQKKNKRKKKRSQNKLKNNMTENIKKTSARKLEKEIGKSEDEDVEEEQVENSDDKVQSQMADEMYDENSDLSEINSCGHAASLTAYSYLNNYINWINNVMASDFPGDFEPEEVPRHIPRKLLLSLPKSNATYCESSINILLAFLLFQILLFL